MPKVKIPTLSPQKPRRHGWGTLEFFFLFIVLLIFAIFARAEGMTAPVSYELKIRIEPAQGTIGVHGNIGVPVEAGARTLQFGLHETFAIRKLLINNRPAKFSFHPGDPSPIYPATRKVLVHLPAPVPAGTVHLEIEYGGKLKQIPEFDTFPDQKQAMDDQINSRLVELANYSS